MTTEHPDAQPDAGARGAPGHDEPDTAPSTPDSPWEPAPISPPVTSGPPEAGFGDRRVAHDDASDEGDEGPIQGGTPQGLDSVRDRQASQDHLQPHRSAPAPVERRIAAVHRVLGMDTGLAGGTRGAEPGGTGDPQTGVARAGTGASPAPEQPPPLRIVRIRPLDDEQRWRRLPGGPLASLLENLPALSDITGLELTIGGGHGRPDQPRSAVVVDESSGSEVLIVVDDGRTSDESAGVLLRHVVNEGVRIALWVSTQDRPEHVAVASWLADTTGSRIFTIRVMAVQVEQRAVALALMTSPQP